MTAILDKGPISRARISRETGLSKQTASEIVRLLEQAGWIEETGVSRGNVGRSAILYRIIPDSAYIVGVDLGGTKLTVAIADMTGDLVAEETVPTDERGAAQVIRQIGALCRELADHSGVVWEKVRLAVVGMPGAVDSVTGFVEFAPNLPGFDTLRAQDELCALLGVHTVIENDVNLAAIGERWRGAGQGIDDLVFIALGTGIGQGIVLGGKLLRGTNGLAGEIGYLPLCTDPFTQQARSVGAFECAVGSRAILDLYREKRGECDSVREIFQRAADGEAEAEQVLDEISSRLALGVATTAALIDPRRVIFGGSVGGRAELLERVRRIMPRCMRRPPIIEASRLGSRAGIVGALGYGLEELHRLTHGPEFAQLPPSTMTAARSNP